MEAGCHSFSNRCYKKREVASVLTSEQESKNGSHVSGLFSCRHEIPLLLARKEETGENQPTMNTVKAIKNAIVCLVLLPRFLVAAVLFWLLDFLCIRKRVFFRMRPHEEGDAIDPPLCISDSNRLCTLESLKAVWHGHKLDFLKAARLGCGAPNTEVVQLRDQKRSRVLDYAQGDRPLILNFGSCT